LLHWYLPRFTEAALGAATLSASTAFAASVTIAHRMVLMSDPANLWHGPGRNEALRMVGEKLDAAAEGSLEAAFEVGRLAMRSVSGRLTTDDVAQGLVAIGVAATRPAARRARANARRLSRG